MERAFDEDKGEDKAVGDDDDDYQLPGQSEGRARTTNVSCLDCQISVEATTGVMNVSHNCFSLSTRTAALSTRTIHIRTIGQVQQYPNILGTKL